MNGLHLFKDLRLIVLSLMLSLMVDAVAAAQPNVIVIMADDLGAEGLASYGSTIYTTPHLDRMAAEGVRFENAYATPLCTPTRVMIMSGLYPHRSGFLALVSKDPNARMPADIPTFGHYFRDAGYKTAIAGKWQLGQFDAHPGQPAEHGFDRYCMWSWFYEGKKRSRYFAAHYHQDGSFVQQQESEFGPDAYATFMLDFIDEHKDQPFFMYFPMALTHSPFLHPPRLGELASTHFTDDLDGSVKEFGHMITYMDDIIGQMVDRLEQHGIANNTLVIFTADNGTHKSLTSKLPGLDVKGEKGAMVEAGMRVPFLAWWPGTITPAVRDELLCLVDVLPTITAIAGIELTAEVDGMDLSHNLLGGDGQDREQIFMSYKGDQWLVRDHKFRLDQDGTLFDIPVTSDAQRYSEKVSDNPEHEVHKQRLQVLLDEFKATPPLYSGQEGKAEKQKKKKSR